MTPTDKPGEAELRELVRVGYMMANTMFNLKQRDSMPADLRASFAKMQMQWDDAVRALAAQAAKPDEAPARCEDSERLNYLIAEGAFIVWTLRDGSIRQCQVWTQDEDEEHHQPAGESRFFNTEREAIDAAIAAKGKTE